VVSRFPDVAERSVRTYAASTLAFITEAGMVRRRSHDERPTVPPLYTARGAFRPRPKEIRLALTVTPNLLRGSSLELRPAVATALGVSPGQRRVFSNSHGDLSVAWRVSSTNGPSIGSLRLAAAAIAAGPSDTLVLAFRLDDAARDVTRISADVGGMQRLQPLLGRTVRNPAAALAASLHCRRAEVAAVLRKRGDQDLAELLDE
jgi:hypothetical protein